MEAFTILVSIRNASCVCSTELMTKKYPFILKRRTYFLGQTESDFRTVLRCDPGCLLMWREQCVTHSLSNIAERRNYKGDEINRLVWNLSC